MTLYETYLKEKEYHKEDQLIQQLTVLEPVMKNSMLKAVNLTFQAIVIALKKGCEEDVHNMLKHIFGPDAHMLKTTLATLMNTLAYEQALENKWFTPEDIAIIQVILDHCDDISRLHDIKAIEEKVNEIISDLTALTEVFKKISEQAEKFHKEVMQAALLEFKERFAH